MSTKIQKNQLSFADAFDFLKNLDTNREMNGLKTNEQFLKFVILLFCQKKKN